MPESESGVLGFFGKRGGVDGNPPLLHAFAFEDYDGGLGGLAGAILLPPPLCTMKAVSFPCWLVVGWDFCISFSTLLPFLCAREGGGRTASLLLLRLFLFFLKKKPSIFGGLKSDESVSLLGGKFEVIFIGTKWEDFPQKRFSFSSKTTFQKT